MATNPNLSINRYFRLMAMASADILFTLPLACYSLLYNLTVKPLMPWKGWADTHINFGFVGQYPSIVWHLDPTVVGGLELNRWNPVIAAFVFFGFFGFVEEARKNYRSLALTIIKHSGIEKFTITRNKAAAYALLCYSCFLHYSQGSAVQHLHWTQ
jgi:pheromone a factor receptor